MDKDTLIEKYGRMIRALQPLMYDQFVKDVIELRITDEPEDDKKPVSFHIDPFSFIME